MSKTRSTNSTEHQSHQFNIKVKDNKLKAIMTTSMFRNRVEKNAKAYTRKAKHRKSEGWGY